MFDALAGPVYKELSSLLPSNKGKNVIAGVCLALAIDKAAGEGVSG